MVDLTRPDHGEAIERMTRKLEELDQDEVGPYFLLCMAVLARNAPDVATFVMDRVDDNLAATDEALAAASESGGEAP